MAPLRCTLKRRLGCPIAHRWVTKLDLSLILDVHCMRILACYIVFSVHPLRSFTSWSSSQVILLGRVRCDKVMAMLYSDVFVNPPFGMCLTLQVCQIEWNMTASILATSTDDGQVNLWCAAG